MKEESFLKSEIHDLIVVVWKVKHLLLILEEITVNDSGNLSESDIYTLQDEIINMVKYAAEKANSINSCIGI